MTIDWNQIYWNNTLAAYAFALAYAIGATLIARLAIALLSSRTKRLAEGGRLPLYLFWHGLQATRTWIVFLLFLTVALFSLELPIGLYPWLRTFFMVVFMVQVLFWGNRALTSWGERYEPSAIQEMGARFTTVTMFIFFGRLVFWLLCLLVIVDSFPGVEITALVAGLGIGGIAVALALQNILSDVFASLTITLDKPFVLGDFIIVGDYLGSVEHIGLKTTRIRSLSGELLVFANNDLLQSRIQNYKHMKQRRVAFQVRVTYDTPPEKLRSIPPRIKEIVESLPDTRFDRAHFMTYSDYSLAYEIVYYVDGPDFNRYADRQQAINLAIHEFFTEQGIEFALPTQTLHLRQDDPAIEDALKAVVSPATGQRTPEEA